VFKAHFKGWASKWDEYIKIYDDLIDSKYAEVGLYSDAYGFAKFHANEIFGC
jgi:hypothetical protein